MLAGRSHGYGRGDPHLRFADGIRNGEASELADQVSSEPLVDYDIELPNHGLPI